MYQQMCIEYVYRLYLPYFFGILIIPIIPYPSTSLGKEDDSKGKGKAKGKGKEAESKGKGYKDYYGTFLLHH